MLNDLYIYKFEKNQVEVCSIKYIPFDHLVYTYVGFRKVCGNEQDLKLLFLRELLGAARFFNVEQMLM